MPRLRDAPGTTLRLLVVSTGARHCAGIDLESGAMVRAWAPGPVDQGLRPYDVVTVTINSDTDLVPDPSEPEAVALVAPPVYDSRVTGRAAKRLIRPLLHPGKGPLLGFHGPTVPFWERTPDHPSVALAEPPGGVVVSIERDQMWCHFQWSRRPVVLACQDPRLQTALLSRGRRLARLRPGTLVVVALSPPVIGYCHKVVEAVIPRR